MPEIFHENHGFPVTKFKLPLPGESSSYGGYYWIAMEYYIGQQYDSTAYSSLNVARAKCLASKTVSGLRYHAKYHVSYCDIVQRAVGKWHEV